MAAFYAHFKADFAIFGVGGLDEGGMLLDFNGGEVEARRAMVSGSKGSVFVADISKFGLNATVPGGQHRRELPRVRKRSGLSRPAN